MKFQLKSLVAAAALAAAGVASAGVNPDVISTVPNAPVIVFDPAGSGRGAELTLLNSGGALSFSNGGYVLGSTTPGSNAIGGLVAALNVGKVVLTSVDNAVVTQLKNPARSRYSVSIGAAVNGLSADGNTGEILTVSSFGGAQQDAAFQPDVLNGGRMVVKNLRFDLQNKAVIADMYGQAMVGGFVNDEDVAVQGTLGPVVEKLNVTLWNIGSIVGPTVLPPEGLLAAAGGNFKPMEDLGYSLTKTEASTVAGWGPKYTVSATNSLNNLTVTEEGFAFFAESLGLIPDTLAYNTLNEVNLKAGGWGSISSNIVFTAQEIPEPSTYALMGLGLVGISLVARRRAK